MTTDVSDWETMQCLKKDIARLKTLDPVQFKDEIEWDERHLTYFKKKAVVESNN
jgi:hypothetical protein